MADFLTGIAFFLIIEGLVYALAPSVLRRMAEMLPQIPENQLRTSGLVAVAAGVAMFIVASREHGAQPPVYLALITAGAMAFSCMIAGIAGTMEDVNTHAATIAAAVEEQGAATSEIGSSVEAAARETGTVADNVDDLAAAVGDTRAAAGRVLDAAGAVNAVKDELAGEIERFLKAVAAA